MLCVARADRGCRGGGRKGSACPAVAILSISSGGTVHGWCLGALLELGLADAVHDGVEDSDPRDPLLMFCGASRVWRKLCLAQHLITEAVRARLVRRRSWACVREVRRLTGEL